MKWEWSRFNTAPLNSNCKHLDWSTYFSGTAYTKKYEVITAFKASSGSFYVTKCDFIHQTDFAAVRIGDSSSQDNLLVEETMFSECSSTGSYSYGGSLYFVSKGNFIQDRACYSKCTKDSGWDLAYYVDVPDDVNIKLFINLTTISNCGTGISVCYGTFEINKGPEYSSNLNITENKCNQYPAYIHDGSISNVNAKFLNIKSNMQTTEAIIGIWTDGLTKISHSNIIENERTKDSRGVLTGYGNFELDSCCIIRNIGSPTFFSPSKTISLNSCYADSYSTGSCTLTTKNSANAQFSIIASFLSLGECVAEIVYANSIKKHHCSVNNGYSCHCSNDYLIYYVIVTIGD